MAKHKAYSHSQFEFEDEQTLLTAINLAASSLMYIARRVDNVRLCFVSYRTL